MRTDNKKIKIANNIETVRKIQCGNSICRYGDGEFNLILGGRTRLQPGSIQLVERLKEILVDKTDNILIGIPEAFDNELDKFTENASKFWYEYNKNNLEKILDLLDLDKQYYSSQITWFYTDIKDKNGCDDYVGELKKIWNNKDILIVEGAHTRMGLGNDLFKNAKSIKRILCPPENAYIKYDEILNCCLECSRDSLVIIALGATATVLAYDLAKNGFQAIDMGHVDLEYEWYKRKAESKVKIKNKFNEEINDCEVFEGDIDTEYKKSILEIIE